MLLRLLINHNHIKTDVFVWQVYIQAVSHLSIQTFLRTALFQLLPNSDISLMLDLSQLKPIHTGVCEHRRVRENAARR